jgi:CubicO group peptidase (beta-lactamase class C family)
MGIMQGYPPPVDKRITLENWDRPPFNRWAFQHIREVIPTVEVFRGVEPVWSLANSGQEFDDLEILHQRNGARRTVIETLEQIYTDGFIVIHNNRIAYERYFNDMGPDTLHLSQSVAKSVAATVCGILIDRGEINRDAPLAEILPELVGSGYADATLRQVMDMRSGIRFSEDYTDPDADIAMIDYAAGWKPWRVGKPQAVHDIPALLPKVREHGGDFEYRSIETDVMAWVMQRVTGRPLDELVSEELWQPMGAEFDACFTVDQAGYPLASGGFNASLRDYARVGLLYLNDGYGNDRQIVPAEWVRETREDGDNSVFKSYLNEHFDHGAYKNQFWVRDLDKQQIMARGVFGQTIYIDPTSNLVAVALSTWPDFINTEFLLDQLDVIDNISELAA